MAHCNFITKAQSTWVSEDKVVHFFLFLVFGVILLSALKKEYYKSGLKNTLVIAASVLLVSAIASESLQLIVDNRAFDFYDFAIDVFGIIIAFVIFRLVFGKDIFKT